MFTVGGLMRRKKQADTTQLSPHMIIEFFREINGVCRYGCKGNTVLISRKFVRKKLT